MDGVSELQPGSDAGIASAKWSLSFYRLILWNFIIQVWSWAGEWFGSMKHVIKKGFLVVHVILVIFSH